jgi:hypothetical protein
MAFARIGSKHGIEPSFNSICYGGRRKLEELIFAYENHCAGVGNASGPHAHCGSNNLGKNCDPEVQYMEEILNMTFNLVIGVELAMNEVLFAV